LHKKGPLSRKFVIQNIEQGCNLMIKCEEFICLFVTETRRKYLYWTWLWSFSLWFSFWFTSFSSICLLLALQKFEELISHWSWHEHQSKAFIVRFTLCLIWRINFTHWSWHEHQSKAFIVRFTICLCLCLCSPFFDCLCSSEWSSDFDLQKHEASSQGDKTDSKSWRFQSSDF
jgi:hypothetical protein